MVAGRDVPAVLLDDVKNYLDITWDDDHTDAKTREYIVSGMIYLDGKLGEPADYLTAGSPRSLLLEYVRYARDGAMDIFETNYVHLILAMQHERAVERYAKSADATQQ